MALGKSSGAFMSANSSQKANLIAVEEMCAAGGSTQHQQHLIRCVIIQMASCSTQLSLTAMQLATHQTASLKLKACMHAQHVLSFAEQSLASNVTTMMWKATPIV
jgi:hypothetical protein